MAIINMPHSSDKKSVLGYFIMFLLILMILGNTYYLKNYYFKSFLYFVIFMLSWISIAIYTIWKSKFNILMPIVLVLFITFLRTILRVDNTFWGWDNYASYAVAYQIYNSHRWTPLSSLHLPPDSLNLSRYVDFPIVYISGVMYSYVVNVNLFYIIQWVPLLISLFSLFFIYLTAYRISESKKTSLLSVLLFSMYYTYIEMYSTFIKETLAFIFFVEIIYLIYFKKKDNKSLLTILLLSIALAMSHHLTSFLLFVFLISTYIIAIALRILNNIMEKKSAVTQRLDRGIFVTLVILVGYWIYIKQSPIILALNELQRISLINNQYPYPLAIQPLLESPSYRKIYEIKDFLTLPIFTLLLILYPKIDKKRYNSASFPFWISSIIFVTIMGTLTITFTKLVKYSGSGTLWGGRFIQFSNVFLFVFSSAVIMHIFEENRKHIKISKVLLAIFLCIYITLQILSIPSSLYLIQEKSQYEPPFQQTALFWFQEEGTICGPPFISLLRYIPPWRDLSNIHIEIYSPYSQEPVMCQYTIVYSSQSKYINEMSNSYHITIYNNRRFKLLIKI